MGRHAREARAAVEQDLAAELLGGRAESLGGQEPAGAQADGFVTVGTLIRWLVEKDAALQEAALAAVVCEFAGAEGAPSAVGAEEFCRVAAGMADERMPQQLLAQAHAHAAHDTRSEAVGEGVSRGALAAVALLGGGDGAAGAVASAEQCARKLLDFAGVPTYVDIGATVIAGSALRGGLRERRNSVNEGRPPEQVAEESGEP